MENLLVGIDESVHIGFCTSAVKLIGRKVAVFDIREMRYNGAVSRSGVGAEPGCVTRCRGSVRTGIGKRSTCVVLSILCSSKEQALLGSGAAIKSGTFHEGRTRYCQLPRNFCGMGTSVGVESRYRGVGVDNVEGVFCIDIIARCSRYSKVVRMSD